MNADEFVCPIVESHAAQSMRDATRGIGHPACFEHGLSFASNVIVSRMFCDAVW